MSLDRGSRREGRGCIRARRWRSTATHGEAKDGILYTQAHKANGGAAAVLGRGASVMEAWLRCVEGLPWR